MSHARHHVSNIANFRQVSLTDSERKQQTQMIMKLFEHWHLTNKEQAIALGLSPDTQTSIANYKNGKQCLPLFRDIQDRVGLLLSIHKYLRRAYPFNKELAYRWITTPNADFHYQSPFDVICKEGYMGLVRVKNYLELNQLS